MNVCREALYAVKPVLITRAYGGYLAVTPAKWPLRIGVVGDTEAEAIAAFEVALKRWSELAEVGNG